MSTNPDHPCRRRGEGEGPTRIQPPATLFARANRFLDAIEGKPSRLCSLEAGVQTLRFNLAALAAAESGQRVTCASLTADVRP